MIPFYIMVICVPVFIVLLCLLVYMLHDTTNEKAKRQRDEQRKREQAEQEQKKEVCEAVDDICDNSRIPKLNTECDNAEVIETTWNRDRNGRFEVTTTYRLKELSNRLDREAFVKSQYPTVDSTTLPNRNYPIVDGTTTYHGDLRRMLDDLTST